jgi:hypothetical protein
MNPVPRTLQALQGVHVPLTDADYIRRPNCNKELALKALIAKAAKKIEKEEEERIQNLKAVHYA